MFKKIIAMTVVLAMLLSTSVCFAGVKQNREQYIQTCLEKMLENAAQDSKSYGMDGVDFDNLKIGNRINYYEDNGDNISKISGMEYYPIFDDDNVVAMLYIGDNSDTPLISFGASFAENINDLLDKKTMTGALITDNSDLYFKSSDNVDIVMSDNAATAEKQVSRTLKATETSALSQSDASKKYTDLEENVLEPLEDVNTLQVSPKVYDDTTTEENVMKVLDTEELQSPSMLPQNALSVSGFREHSLPVTWMSQGKYPMCWAASTAMVGYYKTNIRKTAQNVADQMGIGYNDGGSPNVVISALKKCYSLSASWKRSMSTSTIYSSIDNDNPLVGAFSSNKTNMGHMVTINGYFYDSSTVFLMYLDPQLNSSIMQSTMKNGDFTLQSPNTAYEMTGCILLK